MGAYTFDDPSKIKRGRIGGRKAFSKKFREQMLDHYGSRDAITGEKMDGRYLQIDHRIPYEVAGDNNGETGELDPADFMLLDASSNRAKSWSCEHCENFLKLHDPAMCQTCFWASPEAYEHVAGVPSRRLHISWTGAEVAEYEAIKDAAEAVGLKVSEYIKQLLAKQR